LKGETEWRLVFLSSYRAQLTDLVLRIERGEFEAGPHHLGG
jgi:hypothetical protein